MSSTKVSKSKKSEPVVEVKPEPVVEVKPDVVEDAEDADESKKQTFEELMDQFTEQYKNLRAQTLALGAMIGLVRRAHNQGLRAQVQKKKVRKAVVDSGILKPVHLPPEAETFLKAVGVKIPDDKLMRRTELSGAIYDYVKANSLYKPDSSKDSGFDRKVIIPDVKLRTLFSLSADKTLDFSSINVNLATIYRRAKEADAAAAGGAAPAAAPAAPAKTPAPAAAAPAKKGKAAGSSA
jgi:chromatin remodeling complex protein RSC6